jgi:hypothetical protein
MNPDLGISLRLELTTRDPVGHDPGNRIGAQRRRGGEVGAPRLTVAGVEPDFDLAAQRPRAPRSGPRAPDPSGGDGPPTGPQGDDRGSCAYVPAASPEHPSLVPGRHGGARGNKVEPPCRGVSHWRVQLEVGRFRVRHIAGAGVMGEPGPWSTGGRHIVEASTPLAREA